MSIEEIRQLLVSLKGDIDDDYRCDEEDDEPGMLVTIATTDGEGWNYQTGDNSFTGGCYGFRHWSVVYLYRDSNCRELGRDAVNELRDEVAEAKAWATV